MSSIIPPNNNEQQLFSEFEDLLDKNNEHNDIEEYLHNNLEDDAMVHKLDASSLLLHDLLTEMERRGLHPRGFFEDDAKVLQAEFDKEHESYVESKRREKREAREMEAKQAIIQKRRMVLDTQMMEERKELEEDKRLKADLDRIIGSICATHIRIGVNDISVRSLSKAMWQNNNVLSLDVSNMNLTDLSGSYICRALKKNRSIRKLELGGNQFGPKTCLTLANSLSLNDVLKYVSLESNPLTQGTNYITAMEAIAEMLKVNKTLTYLSIWRCNINSEGCKILSDCLAFNQCLTCFEMMYNDFENEQIQEICLRLKKNREIERHQINALEKKEKEKQEKKRVEREKIAVQIKKKEKENWIEGQKKERSEARLVKLEKIATQKLSEQKQHEEQELLIKAAKAKSNSKKKKKTKKKKK